MIPMKFLSKIGIYEIQIHGVTLKVRVVHAKDDSIFDICISELRSQFGTTVVGLMIQPDQNSNYLQLCVGTRCLMYEIPYCTYTQPLMPKSLNDFLSNSEICFVGVNEQTNCRVNCKNYVKLSELGARVLKKRNLISSSLEALANEVGINLEKRSSVVNVDWKAKAFSDEEIKCATRDVCACYLIGNKLLGSL